MRPILLLIMFLMINSIHGQQMDIHTAPDFKTGDSVTVIAIFDKMNVTKDGYYFGDYVVELSAKEAKQFDGKKIKISGVLNIIPGLGPETIRYDSLGSRIVSQGREGDTRYILNPVIEIYQP